MGSHWLMGTKFLFRLNLEEGDSGRSYNTGSVTNALDCTHLKMTQMADFMSHLYFTII